MTNDRRSSMSEMSSRRLDVDTLRALRAIKVHGGVTRAAAALGLSQSAVSHKIKRMEVSLGCDLLDRRAGGTMFTPEGEGLLDYAVRILGLHDEALVSFARSDLAGRILLGFTEDTTCTDLSAILGRFRRVHPNVAVRTKVRMSLVLQSMLERGQLDVAIAQVFAHEVRPTDVVLLREALHWVKSRELSLSPGKPSRSYLSTTSASTVAGLLTSASMEEKGWKRFLNVQVPPVSSQRSAQGSAWRCSANAISC